METADLRASKNIQYRAESAGKYYKSPQKIWLKRLVDYGYQQRRSFSDIENVMAEAASKIAKKEDNKDNLI